MNLNQTQRDITVELFSTLQALNEQILEVGRKAEALGCKPCEVQSMSGDFLLTPLLVAKSNALSGLAHIHGRP